jgi:D-alanyl-D-alanine dipeptidase
MEAVWKLNKALKGYFNTFPDLLAYIRTFWQTGALMWLMQTCTAGTYAQQNPYGLSITTSLSELKQQVDSQPLLQMVDLTSFIPALKTQWVYAGAQNFTGVVLYTNPRPYLRLAAAQRLRLAADSFQKLGLGILLYDAYRPYSVTLKMWEKVPDDRYAANPATGSGHNRGIAIDLTLYDLKSGQPLRMPTAFDNFSDTAHHSFEQLPPDVLRHRALLKGIMEYAGFVAMPTEWWHYSLPQAKSFPLMDLSFQQLRQAWRHNRKRHH